MTVPVIKSFEQAVSSSAGATLTCTKPADVDSGDLLLLLCCNDGNNVVNEFTDNKSGWTFLGQAGDGVSDAHIGVFYKISNGSEGSSESVSSNTSNDWTMFYISISGADTTTPINGSLFAANADNTKQSITGVTTDEDDCLCLYGLSFNGNDGYSFSVSGTGWVEKAEAQASGGSGGSSGCWGAKDLPTQGASGLVEVYCSASDGAAVCQVAINAATGGFPTYEITADETIEITIPASALTGGVEIVATPTFDILAGGATLLVINNSTQAQTLSTLSLIQHNTLNVADILQAQILENVALGVSTLLAIDDLLQAQSIDTLNLLQAGILSISDILQPQEIDNLNLTQKNILDIDNALQAQALENLGLTQANIIAINNSIQAQLLDNVDLVQANVLVINEVNQAQQLDNITLSLSALLQIADLAQSQDLDIINLLQHNTLVIDGIVQEQLLTNISLSVGVILEIANMLQTQGIDFLDLLQKNNLSVNNILQAQTLENLELDLATILQIANVLQSQSLDNIELTQAYVLAINDLLQAQGITEISFAIIKGKVSVTFLVKTPSTSQGIKIPGTSFNLEG